MHEWEEWHRVTKVTHPIRYYIQKTIPRWWDRIAYRWDRRYWAILHRFHPKHRYHVIKPRSLEPGYHDPDTLMLYACMDTFAEYFETGAQQFVYEEKYELERFAEMEEIYNWWTKDWPNCDTHKVDGTLRIDFPTLPEEWGKMPVFNPKYSDTPEIKAWREAGDALHQDDEDWAKKEEEMLCRLIKIRRSLWY